MRARLTGTASALVGGVLVLSSLLASCAGPTGNLGGGTATRGATEAIAYSAQYDEIANQAATTLVSTCMVKRGVKYTSPVFRPPDPSEGGYQDLMFVGYSRISSETPITTNQPPDKPMDEATRSALWGDPLDIVQVTLPNGQVQSRPKSGCHAESWTKLYGSIESESRKAVLIFALLTIRTAAQDAAARSPDYLAVRDRWRECMARSGLSYTSPDLVPQSRPKDTAVALWPVAKQDLECKAEAGLLAAAERATAREETRLLATQPGLVTEWKSLMDTLYSRSKDAVAGTLP